MNKSLKLTYNYLKQSERRFTYVHLNGERARYNAIQAYSYAQHIDQIAYNPDDYYVLFIIGNGNKPIKIIEFYKDKKNNLKCSSPHYKINQDILDNLLLRSI